jgi:hypothetical protein
LTGIQIPIYVIIFGISGGYLRYLYKTAKLQKSVNLSDRSYLFSWNNIPGSESEKLKYFLKENFNLEWIIDQEFQKKGNSVEASNKKNSVSILLEHDKEYAAIIINGRKIMKLIVEEENGMFNIYHTIDRRRSIFYQSLEDLSLFFLAPLLAIAVWFILYQGGTTSTLAISIVSFAVGLITEEIIQTIIRISSSTLKRDSTKEVQKNEGTNNIVS